MPRVLIPVLIIVMVVAMSACGDFDIANQITESDVLDLDTPEDARVMLNELDIPYTIDEFVECARQSDAVAVELFLTAGMNPAAKDRNGDTALKVAKEAGHATVIEVLEALEEEEAEEQEEELAEEQEE